MITRLRVKNYKSLKDLDLPLRPFNVLIGPNAAGKSNIIDALVFLAELAKGTQLNQALSQRGGFERVVFRGRAEEVQIALEFLLDQQPHSYVVTFDHERITGEELWLGGLELKGEEILEKDGQGHVKGEGGGFGTDRDRSALDQLRHDAKRWPRVHRTSRVVNSFSFYQIIPAEIRKALEIRGEVALDRSGANLARVLHTLRNQHEEVFEKIELLLRQAIREAERLRTPVTIGRGNTSIGLQEETLEADFHQLSDGTLQVLALVTAVSLPQSQLVCIEEPENFIHARLQQFLVEVFKISGKQIIISTHNPYLVNFVEPEDVIIVEKEEGETTATRVDSPDELKVMLKDLELRLGEYYHSGALGGTP